MWDLFAVLLVSRLLSWRRLRCCFIASLIDINAAGFVIHGLLPHRSMTFLRSTRPRWPRNVSKLLRSREEELPGSLLGRLPGRVPEYLADSRKALWQASRKVSQGCSRKSHQKNFPEDFVESWPSEIPGIHSKEFPEASLDASRHGYSWKASRRAPRTRRPGKFPGQATSEDFPVRTVRQRRSYWRSAHGGCGGGGGVQHTALGSEIEQHPASGTPVGANLQNRFGIEHGVGKPERTFWQGAGARLEQ